MKTLRAVLEQLRLKLTFQARDGMVGDQIVTIAEPVGDECDTTQQKVT